MPTREEKINALVAKRKGDWVLLFQEDPSRAAELMNQYGVPNMGESLFQGVQQGIAHGFADDFERMTRGDGVASNHIRAEAANPGAYMLGTVLGTGAMGLGVRRGGEVVGEAAVANSKRASSRMGAGFDPKATANAAKVESFRKAAGQFPFVGAKPAVRAAGMDALHGAAWGYGGADASKDEEAFDLERLKRAAIGAGSAAVLSPFVVAGVGAAGNAPLAWGGRRIGSKKMYEPPGVTKANPAGLPKRAIDIAKAKDEVSARGMRLPDDTGRSENMGKLNRDPVPPLQSVMPRTQKLADQVLAVRAPERIADLKERQRIRSSRLVREAYPKPTTDMDGFDEGTALYHGTMVPGVERLRIGQNSWRKKGEAPVDNEPWIWTTTDKKQAKGFATGPKGERGQVLEMRGRGKFIDGENEFHMRYDGDPKAAMADGYAGYREGPVQTFFREEDIRPASQRPGVPDSVLDEYAQVISRPDGPDRPVLEDWYGKLQSLNAKDPTVMPRMKAILARVAAENEVNAPAMNDAGPMRAYLNRMGMGGNKSENRPPVVQSAREQAAQAFPTERYEDALQRTRTIDYPVRPRHADAIEAEMQGYQQPAYVDPALSREQSLVARGDDKAAWVNPLDFVADMFTKREKTPEWAVQWAGGLSGPIAYGTESILAANEPRGEWTDPKLSEPGRKPAPGGLIGGAAPRKPVSLPAPQPAAAPAATASRPAPAAPVEPPAVQNATPDQVLEPVRTFQKVLIAEGIDIGPERDDGRFGENTRRGLMALQFAMGVEPTGEMDARTIKYINMLASGELQRSYPQVYADFRARLHG